MQHAADIFFTGVWKGKNVSTEEFFPECLAETVLEKLSETVALQADVKKQFSALGTGNVPLKLKETAALLEEFA